MREGTASYPVQWRDTVCDLCVFCHSLSDISKVEAALCVQETRRWGLKEATPQVPAHETISTIRRERNGGAHGRPSTRFEPVSVHLEGTLLTSLCTIRGQGKNPCTVKEVAGSNSQNYNHLPSVVLETISLSQRTVTSALGWQKWRTFRKVSVE